jgi:hypothetical protein
MSEASIPALQDAIRHMHGCESAFVESVPVVERFVLRAEGLARDQIVWEGAVSVFDLIGHPTAKRCYAWSAESYPPPFGRRFTAVLQEGPVTSPADAVRASIVADWRKGR